MADPALDSLFAAASALHPTAPLEFTSAGFLFMSSVFPDSQGGLVFNGQGLPATLSGQLYPDSEQGTSDAMPVGTVTIAAPMLLPSGPHGEGGLKWTDYSLTVTTATAKQVLTPQAAGPVNGLYFVYGTWVAAVPTNPAETWVASLMMTIGTPFLANKP